MPHADVFSYSASGKPWFAHEWLSEVVFYLLYSHWGVVGLTSFKAALISLSAVLLWTINRRSPLVSFILLGVAVLGLRQLFVERPFIFDFFFLSVLLTLFWNVDFDSPKRSVLASPPLITLLWCNLHGAASLMCPVLVAVAALAEYAAGKRAAWRSWAASAGAAFLAVGLNPNGFHLLSHLRVVAAESRAERILEWKSPGTWFQDWPLYLAFLVLGLWSAWTCRKSKPSMAAWTAVLAAASLTAVRHAPFLLACAAPLTAFALSERVKESAKPAARLALRAALCMGLAAAAYWQIEYARGLSAEFGFGEEHPVAGALEFLDRAGVDGKMFNEYATGGDLLWLAAPRRRVFVDGRNDLYGPEIVNAAIRYPDPTVWSSLNKTWGFDYAIVTPRRGDYPTRVLDDDPAWRLVFWDDKSFVYLRDEPANAAAISRYGLRLLRPGEPDYHYLGPVLRDPKKAKDLLGELDRSGEAAPGSANALLMKADVLAALHRVPEARAAAERAVGLFPRKAQPLYTRGWLKEAVRDLPGAEADYRSALSLLRGKERLELGADLWNNLGAVHQKLGRRDLARADYENALRLNPKQADAARNLSRL